MNAFDYFGIEEKEFWQDFETDPTKYAKKAIEKLGLGINIFYGSDYKNEILIPIEGLNVGQLSNINGAVHNMCIDINQAQKESAYFTGALKHYSVCNVFRQLPQYSTPFFVLELHSKYI